MTLKKGFLKPQNKLILSKKQFVFGLLLGVFLSILLYGIAMYLFEFFRRTSSLQCNAMYQFTDEVRSFYAWFYAAIAAILGQSTAIWFWAKSTTRKEFSYRSIGLRLKNIANDQSTLSTYYFTWLCRMATLCFVFFGTSNLFPTYDSLDLHQNCSYLFILMPIVLWLGSWTTLSRVFKRRVLKWMTVSALLIFGGSYLLSHWDVLDHKAWDQKQMQSNLLYQYEVLLPHSEFSQMTEKKYRLVEFSIGYSKTGNRNVPTIIFNNTIIGLQDVAQSISKSKSINNEREIPYVTLKLGADKRIPMHFIDTLKYQIKRARILKIAFATRLESIPFEEKALPITYYGIFQLLSPSSDIDYLDTLGPPPPPFHPCYKCFSNQNYVNLKSNGKITLNDSLLSMTDLKVILRSSIKEDRNYIILYTYDNTCTLGQYLQVYTTLKEVIYELRDELSQAEYGKPYKKLWRGEQEYKTATKAYPLRLVEN